VTLKSPPNDRSRSGRRRHCKNARTLEGREDEGRAEKDLTLLGHRERHERRDAALRRNQGEARHLQVDRNHRADEQEEEPKRRGQVAHDPKEEVEPAHLPQPGSEEQPGVLEIPLQPTPVALGIVDQGLRSLLIGAANVPEKPDLPIDPAHQGGFDEVMAEDFPAKRLTGRAGQEARNNP